MADPWTMAKVGKEFSDQSALFAWAAMAQSFGIMAASYPESYTKAGFAVANGSQWDDRLPELKWLHAIKNQGHGDRIRGSRSKAEGVREGVFDLFLPVASHNSGHRAGPRIPLSQQAGLGKFHGLYIELKTLDRKNHKNAGASDKQLEFQADVRAQGYEAWVCHGWEDARDCLLTYLGKEPG